MKRGHLERRAKIVCTLGPSSCTYGTIKRMVEAGMNVARLNFSHGDHAFHARLAELVRRASRETGRSLAILADLQGPKIRVGRFREGSVRLKKGQEFVLTTEKVEGDSARSSVSYKGFSADCRIGNVVLLDDGLIRLRVISVEGPEVRTKVLHGGLLRNNKGLNLPQSVLSVPSLTKKDKEDLRFVLDLDVDYVAISFVQKAEDVRQLKSLIAQVGKDTPVVAKIEKPQAVQSLADIVEAADAIMIARGDLGVEIPVERVPSIQKNIIAHCNRMGVPVITATQMLESMVDSIHPTRAEATDVANAVFDGTDALMLSAETAAGKHPVQVIQTMTRIIRHAEQELHLHGAPRQIVPPGRKLTVPEAIAYSACSVSSMVGSSGILSVTFRGTTPTMFSRFRPSEPIMAITPQEKVCRRMALVWGVTALVYRETDAHIDDVIQELLIFLRDKGLVRTGDRLVFTAGVPTVRKCPTNMIQIEEVP